MGTFHCPMGTPFYEGEGCIRCGLCVAKTSDEMIASAAKIRSFLRSLPERKSDLRKIVVCGKGGAGKSTVVALLANVLREEGRSVMVLDTDESNPGLHRMLGFEEEPRPLMDLIVDVDGEPEYDTKWFSNRTFPTSDIPGDFILGSDGLRMLQVGKIADPFQGCACSMADVSRDLVKKLVLADNEVLIVDAEAGIESFGRGVERNVDTVLIVVEPSFESIALAEKIGWMADGIGVRMVKAVLNKIPSEDIRRRVVEELARRNISQAGALGVDTGISLAGLEGRAAGSPESLDEMRRILSRLRDGAGATV